MPSKVSRTALGRAPARLSYLSSLLGNCQETVVGRFPTFYFLFSRQQESEAENALSPSLTCALGGVDPTPASFKLDSAQPELIN